MSARHRSVLLASVIVVAALVAGCEKDEPKAPPPSEADAPWRALVADLDGDRLTVHEKLRALDEFATRFPGDHPYEAEVTRRRRELQKAVEADLAAQASRAKAYREEQEATSARRTHQIVEGPLPALAGEVLFRFWPWEDEQTEPGFEPVSMEVEGRPPRVRRAPFKGLGLGALRFAAQELLGEVAPDTLREGDYLKHNDRLNESLNALLRARLGGDLFDEAHPGALDPAALEKLLDEVYVAPDTPLIGAKARELYRLFRPIARDYARVHRFLHRRFGRKKLLAMYRRGLKTHDSSSYETTMLAFYGELAREHDVATEAGLADDWAAPVIVGFWMRRAADGTDRILVKFMHRVAADYDPELAKLLGPE